MNYLHMVVEFVRTYGTTLSLLAAWVTVGWVYWSKHTAWRDKHFVNQVNFSLSYVEDGVLVMRTLAEVTAQSVWLNDLGVSKVRQAASRTTVEQPFVRLDDPEDMSFVYRAVLNVLSEKFAGAYLARSMGLPVECAEFRFAITMERYDDIRTVKMRVLVVKTADLETVFAPGGSATAPNPLYAIRLKTLGLMHAMHRDAGQPGVQRLGRVILCVCK